MPVRKNVQNHIYVQNKDSGDKEVTGQKKRIFARLSLPHFDPVFLIRLRTLSPIIAVIYFRILWVTTWFHLRARNTDLSSLHFPHSLGRSSCRESVWKMKRRDIFQHWTIPIGLLLLNSTLLRCLLRPFPFRPFSPTISYMPIKMDSWCSLCRACNRCRWAMRYVLCVSEWNICIVILYTLSSISCEHAEWKKS